MDSSLFKASADSHHASQTHITSCRLVFLKSPPFPIFIIKFEFYLMESHLDK